ncbi:glycosyltransferase [Caballeronia sp. INSB1]|uniref:glycosyltransferase n=1 Tax=Caballeronia sp. INSB1 TaxID=2921751 RepID=UPI00203312E8|nr:glycosyltransferase [Caballeronia sp. INSB1]
MIAPVTLKLETEIESRKTEAESLKQDLQAQAVAHEARINELVAAFNTRLAALQVEHESRFNEIVAASDAKALALHADIARITEMLAATTYAQETSARNLNELSVRSAEDAKTADALLSSVVTTSLAAQANTRARHTSNLPRVSVVMPVRNRPDEIRAALISVQAQTMTDWEAIVVSDGSTDATADVVREIAASDKRVRLFEIAASGVCPARNYGLSRARGQIIAYLDSDNRALPTYLEEVVNAFDDKSETQCVYAAMVCDAPIFHGKHVLWHPWNREALLHGNFIDLNVFAHRREVYERLGGFDEQLTRLVDWDLILRYTEHQAPLRLPVVAISYSTRSRNRISRRADINRNRFLIRRKWLVSDQDGPRVLYVLDHRTRAGDRHAETEILALRRAGANIEAWAGDGATSISSEVVTLHKYSLESAIRQFQPRVVHIHGFGQLSDVLAIAKTQQIPVTARAQDYEHLEALVSMSDSDGISRADIFPHQVAAVAPRSWIHVTSTVFDTTRFFPPSDIIAGKEPRLVLRVATALPSENLSVFISASCRLRDHRFVLALTTKGADDSHIELIKKEIEEQGAPVELHIDLPYSSILALMTRAELYLHSISDESARDPMRMAIPQSVVEAMATGTIPLMRNVAGLAEVLDERGIVYSDVEDLTASIEETAKWEVDTWRQRRIAAIDWAYGGHTDDLVLRPIFDAWCALSENYTDAPTA